MGIKWHIFIWIAISSYQLSAYMPIYVIVIPAFSLSIYHLTQFLVLNTIEGIDIPMIFFLC